jgi:hypothetical protein
VVVSMSNLWLTDAAREKVDSHYGTEGVYDDLQFNPNNSVRIHMPWTKKESNAMVASVLVQYRKMMALYTKGTGGGDGDPVAYSVWQERDPLTAVTYSAKHSKGKIYLSVVHIMDKQFGFPLTIVKGSIPEDLVVDDAVAKSTPTSMSNKVKVSKEHHGLISAMRTASEKSTRDMDAIASDMKTVFASLDNNTDLTQTERQIQLQNAIESTNSQLVLFERQKNELKAVKRSIVGDPDSPRSKKKRQRIGSDIKLKGQLIKQYKATLNIHMNNLSEVNGDTNDLSNEDTDCSDDEFN